jgi:hypothetical protein
MECTLLKYVKTNDGERLSDELITMISRYIRRSHPCAQEISKLTFYRDDDDDCCDVAGDAVRILAQKRWPPQVRRAEFFMFTTGEPYLWPGEVAAMEKARRSVLGECTSIGYYDSDDGF